MLFFSDVYKRQIMGSIAGWISSPMFSVYAASKAAICRFVESINIELEQSGYQNRILNVSPGSIKGSRFNGEENHLPLMVALAEEIIFHLFNSETLFIPCLLYTSGNRIFICLNYFLSLIFK